MSSSTLWQQMARWLKAASPSAQPAASPEESSRPSRSPAARQLRAEQRHKLQALVREHMIRAGVLSSAYKFRALPLDRVGQSFIVLIELDAAATAHDPDSLQDWESTLQTHAQDSLGLVVKAVYWRLHPAQTTALVPEPPSHEPFPPAPAPTRRPEDFAPTQRLDTSRPSPR